jgi:hypothetical protein
MTSLQSQYLLRPPLAVNQRRKLCKNCSGLLSKNEGEFRKTVFVD